MHADEHRLLFAPFAFGERDVFHAIRLLAERRDAEVAPLRRQGNRHAPFDDRLLAQPVGDQRGDRDDLQVELSGDLLQLREAGHRAVLVHDLDQRAGGLQPGQPGQVHGRFGVTRAAQHALLPGAQGVDVSRTPQVGRPGRGIGQRADRGGAVVDRDARRAAVAQQVRRHREGRAEQRGVVLLHHVQLELRAALFRQRGAQHAAALLEHEVHDLGRDLFGGDDEVAFVLAVLVIDDDDDLSVPEVLDDLLYAIERRLLCHVYF